ncbi:MAG: hypothetical protein GPI90_25050 [Microcystis aeruginosa K13-05]|uniref:hypothetical protein n=1 Tax=Microcystis sp. LE19-41.2A TaxID=3016427 RepID=UPI0022C92A11|nr:hypothetical protein [Microcystis sp. LE19-41.2A]MCZ8046516.1 hypothetical protein [Microcystis sp. LE19-41.2A]NCR82949.1 hypothetical protein [Microcystis aeruginosa K13-10]NCR87642.1 hypothetical protein [Microcystis aeruginosa K13-05]
MILQGAIDRERRRLLHWFLICQITGLLSGGVISISLKGEPLSGAGWGLGIGNLHFGVSVGFLSKK